MALRSFMLSLSSQQYLESHHLGSLRPREFNRRALCCKSNVNNRKVSRKSYAPVSMTSNVDVQIVPSRIPEPKVVRRKDFPADFKFGCSTSAIQIEGSGTEGGRGPATWDIYIQDDIEGPDKSADNYHRYKEDVQLMKKMGANGYRFSMSWSRILPDGTVSGGINQQGIHFYNNYIDLLIKNDITPFVSLHHFDLPQALQDKYNGFLDKQIVEDFKDYADLCFRTFGDRVKHWSTINEPQIFGRYGYHVGLNKPPSKPATDPFLATHHMILAHAEAVEHYRLYYKPYQMGEIGLSSVVTWYEPHENTRQDIDAAERAFVFMVSWILEPLVTGDYPFIMKVLVKDGLPTFTEEEKLKVQGSYDFIGVNYYTSNYASALPISHNERYTAHDQFQHATITNYRNGVAIGDPMPGSDGTYLYPQGLTKALVHMSKTLNNPKMYITENGYSEKRDDTIPLADAIKDPKRIQNILNHLYAINEAMKLGADVNGYFMWSLADSWETNYGYKVRFGLHYTDYLNNLNRTPKESAVWFKRWLRA